MSRYYDYNRPGTSESYAVLRKPHCANVFLAFIKHIIDKPLAELEMVEAGCGTGNYSLVMLDAGVKRVHMFDASESQLKIAAGRVKPYQDEGREVTLKKAVLPEVPLPDNSVDVALCTQVLHHLPASARYEAVASLFRVLRPGGVACLVTSIPEQVKVAPWYMRPWPEAAAAHAEKQFSVPELRDYYEKAGFHLEVALDVCHKPECVETGNTVEDVIKCIRDPNWRRADSMWYALKEDDVERGIAMLRDPENERRWRKEAENLGTEIASVGIKPLK